MPSYEKSWVAYSDNVSCGIAWEHPGSLETCCILSDSFFLHGGFMRSEYQVPFGHIASFFSPFFLHTRRLRVSTRARRSSANEEDEEDQEAKQERPRDTTRETQVL